MSQNNFTELLERCKEGPVFLIGLPGNSGDVLLQKGLEMYLEAHKYRLVQNAVSADTILIHGCGGVDDVWCAGTQLIQNLIQEYPNKKIIVAPSTYHFSHTDFPSLVNRSRSEVYLFVREKNSYSRLKSMNLRKNIHIGLADDTAFLLEGTKYLDQLKKRSRSDYTLFAFRTDRESSLLRFESHPRSLNPLKRVVHVYNQWVLRSFLKRELGDVYSKSQSKIIDASYCDFDTFVEAITHASDIYTDRLHVGIFGAMLGKRVYLYKTRYDKVQGVYEQTLRMYPNVTKMF